MARYDYRCLECDRLFEIQQPMTEAPQLVAACPNCQRIVPVQRQISLPGLQFRGPGWPGQDLKRGPRK